MRARASSVKLANAHPVVGHAPERIKPRHGSHLTNVKGWTRGAPALSDRFHKELTSQSRGLCTEKSHGARAETQNLGFGKRLNPIPLGKQQKTRASLADAGFDSQKAGA
jgi:hypothetical protein